MTFNASMSSTTTGSAASATSAESNSTSFGLLVAISFPIAVVFKISMSEPE